MLKLKSMIRLIEVHSGLTGLIGEKAKFVDVKDGTVSEFDGFWGSSLTESTLRGKPDIEAVDISSRLNTLSDILDVTTKPIIFDGDTGGNVEQLKFTVRALERLGVSAIIIEDKIGLKKNSLYGTSVSQQQDSIANFSEKIAGAKATLVTDDFMVIARIESLILNQGMEDALKRAEAYINAGADAIMIHSCSSDSDEIFEFADHYSKFENKKPLVVVPTTYNAVTEEELNSKGINVVIYANHLLRAAYPSMMDTAISILKNKRSLEQDEAIMSVKDVLKIIPTEN